MSHKVGLMRRENPFSLDREVVATCSLCGATNLRTITIRDIVDSPIQMDKYVSTIEADLMKSFDQIICRSS